MSTAPPDTFLDAPELPEGVESRPRPGWRPWTSWVALVAGFAGALIGALVIGVIAAALGASFDDPPPAVTILGTLVQDACLIGSALVFARLASAPRPWQFGLRPTRFWPALGWIAVAWTAFYAFTAAWVTVFGLTPEEDEVIERLGADEGALAMVAVAALVTVVAPVAEEFFFRGFFFTALRNWRGLWPAALITGAIFGAIHAGSSDPAFLVSLGFFGVALCLLYVRTGSLYPCIVLHAANNTLAFGVMQGWTWQIPLLFACAVGVISAGALAVTRVWQPAPAPAPAA
jgi:uncharacterized protein